MVSKAEIFWNYLPFGIANWVLALPGLALAAFAVRTENILLGGIAVLGLLTHAMLTYLGSRYRK